MSLLSKIKKGNADLPARIVIAGPEGIGKSTFASNAPNPLFVSAEDGLTGLEHVDRFTPGAFEELKKFMDETNERLTVLKAIVQASKKDFQELSETVTKQLSDKASVDNLVELENKIYKEMDKILLTLTKKISGEESKKGFKLLQAQVKRLYEFYTTSAQLLKDTTEDSSMIKRSVFGVSCVSCDKEVSSHGTKPTLNQTQDVSVIIPGKLSLKDPAPAKVTDFARNMIKIRDYHDRIKRKME